MLQPNDFTDAIENAKERIHTGSALEPVLSDLRKRGADKIDSIKIVRTVMNVSTAQAKSLIDRSETWSDRYADDLAIHASVHETAEKLKNEATGIKVVIEEQSEDPAC